MLFVHGLSLSNIDWIMSKVIKVDNLSVRYDLGYILTNISFNCLEGECISVVGKSGSGKTTLLEAIAGLKSYEGKIEMNRTFGYVFQGYKNLYPWMSVYENIAFGIKNRNKQFIADRVKELLNLVDMNGFEKRYPHQLSGGQMQRVSIARALAPNPKILLLDEPFSAIDTVTKIQLEEWLMGLTMSNKITTIIVTHELESALYLSDRVYVLKNGELIEAHKVPYIRPRKLEIKNSQEFIKIKTDLISQLI